ncbi:SMP-30/gluconolactonase/LRE family protein [Neisseriaceae bacterium TC5R-5]|nr:SMP-30/gluconolactonase/LRE family protein [Neisseriaceae bacterium TC5R-5]
MTSPFDCVVREPAKLGECPRWDEHSQQLLWTDIQAPALHRYDPVSHRDSLYPTQEHLGCFALHDNGQIVAGMRSGLWLLDQHGQQVQQLCSNPEDQAHSRFNDGRADPAGRFWAGTVDEVKTHASAGLYRFDERGLHAYKSGLLTSNGLAFSPDHRWLYHSDTPRFTVYRHAFDVDSGEIGPAENWLEMPRERFGTGRPDGAAVDSDGCYWSALYEGGCLIRVAPDGRILQSYPLPVRCPTMCAFGGSDLRTLYVTSASAGRSAEEIAAHPLSGALFAMYAPVAGLPELRCRFTPPQH